MAPCADPVADHYTINEVAAYLRLSRATVYKFVRTGQLEAFRIGSQWRIPKTAVEALKSKGSNQRQPDVES